MCAVEPHIAHRSPTDGHDPPDHGVDELAATMTEHAVVIAGGGPTGLMLAGELALADIDVVIVERRVTQELDGSRRRSHPRTIEVLDQRGIAERFISAGQQHPVAGFAYIQLDVSDFPRHNYVLALWQRHFERILAGWIDELRVPTLRGEEVVGLAQDGSGVDVELAGGRSLRADYLVGCDGGRSVIRKSAGIDFLDWIRRPASSSPRSRWRVRRRSASAPRVVASVPSIANRTGAIPGRVERGARRPRWRADDDLRELLVAA